MGGEQARVTPAAGTITIIQTARRDGAMTLLGNYVKISNETDDPGVNPGVASPTTQLMRAQTSAHEPAKGVGVRRLARHPDSQPLPAPHCPTASLK